MSHKSRRIASVALLAILLIIGTTSATVPPSAAQPNVKPAPSPSLAPCGASLQNTDRVPLAADHKGSTPGAVLTGAPPVSNARLRFGVALPSVPLENQEFDRLAAAAGESPSIVLLFAGMNEPAPVAALERIVARGATPMLTWEPWSPGDGVDQESFSLARISDGSLDESISTWGTALANWGKPVYVRFAHEMNADWYPWGENVNGNGPGDYQRAWRHVHDLVLGAGAKNVRWVWNPNAPRCGQNNLPDLYPGPNYVDYVALDGYNWGDSVTDGVWASPSDLFSPGIQQLRALAPGKPIMIGETASAEEGGSKAAWAGSLISYLNAQQDVVAFNWFDINKEADWRLDSSPAVASAFAEALRNRRG